MIETGYYFSLFVGNLEIGPDGGMAGQVLGLCLMTGPLAWTDDTIGKATTEHGDYWEAPIAVLNETTKDGRVLNDLTWADEKVPVYGPGTNDRLLGFADKFWRDGDVVYASGKFVRDDRRVDEPERTVEAVAEALREADERIMRTQRDFDRIYDKNLALAARLAAVEALADCYERDAQHEGYGGELWSTTAAAIHRALGGGDDAEPK